MMFQAGTTLSCPNSNTSLSANVPLMAIAQANWEVEASATVSTERVFNNCYLNTSTLSPTLQTLPASQPMCQCCFSQGEPSETVNECFKLAFTALNF